MFRMRRLVALILALVWLLAALPARADMTYYLRNRPINASVSGNELWLDASEMRRYLSPSEMARIQLLGDQVQVDRRKVGEMQGDSVPLLAILRALGYVERPNPGLGFVDLVPPDRSSGTTRTADSLRRADYRIAADRMEQILGAIPEYRDPWMLERTEKIGQRVARASPLSNLHWKFLVLDSDVPNAACTGEGHVFVTRGLFMLNLTDDELAGVLGHEIAHGVRRHCFRVVELVRQLNLIERDMEALKAKYAAYQRGESTLVSESSLKSEAEQIERRLEALVDRIRNERVYGRQDEEEADVLGLRYSVQAGYSRTGLSNALRKLERYQQTFGEAVLEDDMTHPPIRRRLEILTRVQASWQ